MSGLFFICKHFINKFTYALDFEINIVYISEGLLRKNI